MTTSVSQESPCASAGANSSERPGSVSSQPPPASRRSGPPGPATGSASSPSAGMGYVWIEPSAARNRAYVSSVTTRWSSVEAQVGPKQRPHR
ncbi:hypothetical protein V2I01_32320 [Micromonospora sp. BRA006-A]|nr:hypothetical protein [Micromonospora sp. BRA006-A]